MPSLLTGRCQTCAKLNQFSYTIKCGHQLVPKFPYRVEFRGPQSWDIKRPYEEPTLSLTSFLTLPKGLQVGQNVLHLKLFSACLMSFRSRCCRPVPQIGRPSLNDTQ